MSLFRALLAGFLALSLGFAPAVAQVARPSPGFKSGFKYLGVSGGGGVNTLNPTTGSPGMKAPSMVLSGGDLTFAGGAAGGPVMSLMGLASGSRTFSVVIATTGGTATNLGIGVGLISAPTNNADYVGGTVDSSGIYNSGQKFQLGGSIGTDPNGAFVPGDTVVVTVDATAHTMTVVVNGGIPVVITAPTGTLYAFVSCVNATCGGTINLSAYP